MCVRVTKDLDTAAAGPTTMRKRNYTETLTDCRNRCYAEDIELCTAGARNGTPPAEVHNLLLLVIDSDAGIDGRTRLIAGRQKRRVAQA